MSDKSVHEQVAPVRSTQDLGELLERQRPGSVLLGDHGAEDQVQERPLPGRHLLVHEQWLPSLDAIPVRGDVVQGGSPVRHDRPSLSNLDEGIQILGDHRARGHGSMELLVDQEDGCHVSSLR